MEQLQNAEQVLRTVQETIRDWYRDNDEKDVPKITEEIRKIRKLGDHRSDMADVVKELVTINTEMWREQDRARSKNDEDILIAIRNISPLNQHRNDLIEEIDEIVQERAKDSVDPEGLTADAITRKVQEAILSWYETKKIGGEQRLEDRFVEFDSTKPILEMTTHLTHVNACMWDEEDVVRTNVDEDMIKAVRKMMPYNVVRNHWVEGIDDCLYRIANEN